MRELRFALRAPPAPGGLLSDIMAPPLSEVVTRLGRPRAMDTI
jgi:hypothetical protein